MHSANFEIEGGRLDASTGKATVTSPKWGKEEGKDGGAEDDLYNDDPEDVIVPQRGENDRGEGGWATGE